MEQNYSTWSGKKIIKIIFEQDSDSNMNGFTLRTYLYRLFISDTLHFYDRVVQGYLLKRPKNTQFF